MLYRFLTKSPQFGIINYVLILVITGMTWPNNVNAAFFSPTSFGGLVGYSYGFTKIGNGEAERALFSIRLNSSGYFWQPWFITLTGGLGFGLSDTDSSSSPRSQSNSVTGNVNFTIFPRSRFPTTIGYTQSNSNSDVENNALFLNRNYEVRRFYVKQNYSNLSGLFSSLTYNKNEFSSTDAGDSNSEFFGIQITKKLRHQDFNFSGKRYINEQHVSNILIEDTNVSLRHNYFPDSEIGITSLISRSETKIDRIIQNNATLFSNNINQIAQASSSFYWRPQHRPYILSGGLRAFNSETTDISSQKTIAANIAGSYRYSRNTRFSTSINANVTETDIEQITNSTQSISAIYTSDQKVIKGYNYFWFTNSTATNLSNENANSTASAEPVNSGDQSIQIFNLSLGHGFGKSWILEPKSTLRMRFHQTIGATESSNENEVRTFLSNSVAGGWSNFLNNRTHTASFSLSDSRNFGSTESEFQLLNLQWSRRQVLSRLSQFQGFLTLQLSRSKFTIENQQNNFAGNGDIATSTSATFNYNNSRIFDIFGLRLNSKLSITDLLSDERENRGRGSWENIFTYSIGLLTTTFTYRLARISGGEFSQSLFFRATRVF